MKKKARRSDEEEVVIVKKKARRSDEEEVVTVRKRAHHKDAVSKNDVVRRRISFECCENRSLW
ncbi:MAG: hypothetical protein N3B12_05730 [Armatimonadetes bacterium]|nr:hypothetical protein [Armatimonadota bacterium]